jgi:alanine-synthesizing transaminase
MNSEFHRIKRLPPYILESVNRLKAASRSHGADIIDFGMGNPDMPTPKHIVDKLLEALANPKSNRYSMSRGVPGLRKALANYYERRFGVTLDPETEIIATLGSKEGLANLAMAITAPGDVVMVPNPAYPIHAFGFIIAGGVVRHLPTGASEDFFESMDRAIRHSVPKPMAVILNYPSNPTAEVRDLDFYRECVAFAKKHDLIIISDLAYAEIYFDCPPPPSILAVPGARDVAIEFTTCSKTYAMPGWRVGFAAGNKALVHALSRIKSYLDYGAFLPIQVAATAALNGPQDCVEEIRQIYRSRRDVLIDSFGRAGWDIPSPKASMFAWAPIPPRFRNLGSLEYSKLLLEHAQIAVAAGIGFGEYGDGHVRIALVENEHRIRQAARNLKRFLSLNEPAAPQELADIG